MMEKAEPRPPLHCLPSGCERDVGPTALQAAVEARPACTQWAFNKWGPGAQNPLLPGRLVCSGQPGDREEHHETSPLGSQPLEMPKAGVTCLDVQHTLGPVL